jgi:NTP pyrophosphatase (non-canonical NTP hydrolase)
MNEKRDAAVTLAELKTFIKHFSQVREWDKEHNPKALSVSIAIEAAELMEKFQFVSEAESSLLAQRYKEQVAHELIDIFVYLLNFANNADIDIAKYFYEKMAINSKRFPVEQHTSSCCC